MLLPGGIRRLHEKSVSKADNRCFFAAAQIQVQAWSQFSAATEIQEEIVPKRAVSIF